MLLRFCVGNYRSIWHKQELSLAASSLDDTQRGLITSDVVPNKQVLPVVVIYGPNASGKSNFIFALSFMRNAVLLSHSRSNPGDPVPRSCFALNAECANEPSYFDADFLIEGVRYHYGFEAMDDRFKSEWLYAFPNGRRQMLFARDEMQFQFGRGLKGRNKIISELTRPNSLFLSAATQNDHEVLSKITAFFRSVRIDSTLLVTKEAAANAVSKTGVDERVINFLTKLGTGITDFKISERDPTEEEEKIHKEVIAFVERLSKEAMPTLEVEERKRRDIQLGHQANDGSSVYFGFERESAGTRRLVLLLSKIYRTLDKGTLLVVDELNANLHTQACEALIALFSSPETNPKNAQFITTTHDTNLLRSAMLRRDQVWFTERDADWSTHLYPLTDIRTRKGDNIERGYLQGRYGAIPFSGSALEFVEEEDGQEAPTKS